MEDTSIYSKNFFILCDKILIIIISTHYNMTIIAQFSKSIIY